MLIFILAFCVIYPPRIIPPGFTTQKPLGQMPVGGATDCEPERYTDTQGRVSLNVGQDNVRANAGDNTG